LLKSFAIDEQLPKPILGEFVEAGRVDRAAVLQRRFVAFAIRFTTPVHIDLLR
jgi:hypothetical protein